jgi:hypothetical protein
VIPVQDIIPGTVARILREAPLTPEKVAFAWRAAVGPAVEKATTIALHDHVLHVRATGPVWQSEIERHGTLIRARLDALLGPGVVRWVRVRVE